MNTARQDDAVALNLKDVQAADLEILLHFDAYCKKHGLRYYLCGGTLLGAVRHGGFIPWDDDVDVFMARPDFDRLFALCEEEPIGEDLELCSVQNHKLPRAFAKVFWKRTRVVRPYLKPIGGANLWIDILPVDGLPSDKKVYRRLRALRDFLEMHNLTSMWRVGRGHRKKMILEYALRYPLAIAVGKWRWAEWMDKLGRKRSYEAYDTVGTLVSGRYSYDGEVMPKAKFEIPVSIEFEGHNFETMSCYKEYLSGIYGDYMTPPPNPKAAHIEGVSMARADYDALCAKYPGLREGHPELH